MKIKTAGDLFTASAKGWGGGGGKIHGEEKIFLYFFARGQATQFSVFVA